ncbi:cell division protein, partial [Azospirillum sp. TSH58]
IAEATGGARYIETVYGRGYKFEAPPEHEEAAPTAAPAAARRFPAIPFAASGLHPGCLVAAE